MRKFSDRNLITTKVAENGVSLHDDELNLIVVETLDPITLKQVIGRARVNRKNPREITVLIPDYSMTDIGNAIASAEQQMKMVKRSKQIRIWHWSMQRSILRSYITTVK